MRPDRNLVVASQRRAAAANVLKAIAASPGEKPRAATGSQRAARFSTLLAETKSPVVARTQLERLIGANDLVGIAYLERGFRAAKSICRIHLRDAHGNTAGFGTGFLVAPGVVMTNHHVIATTTQAATATAEFNYELDVAGKQKETVEFALVVDPPLIAHQALDFCLVLVHETSRDGRRHLAEFAWLPLDPTPGKAFVGEYLTIIQHPGGERKQVCVRENQLIKYSPHDPTLWYCTDTTAGSSGSPVFNGSWQVVAIHHSGVPKTDGQGRWMTLDGRPWDPSMDESQIQWIANEGIRISEICSYLAASKAGHPIAAKVLQRLAPPVAAPVERGAVNGASTTIDGDELRMTIPVQIAVRMAAGSGLSAPTVRTTSTTDGAVSSAAPLVPPAVDVEAVKIDQSNYHKRRGYSQDFLGAGKLRVALPKVSPDLRKFVAPVEGEASGELKYWNYSVVMNKQRRLAFFSAVNVDASLRPEGSGRSGDRWYLDTRIDDDHQTGQDFYGSQREFEADRSGNPFDRGHLTRRLDAQWGNTDDIASRNGNDSFHFTNCAPQYYLYNQGTKKWLGLEDYVVMQFAGGEKASVFNGPVFDAPLSRIDNNGRLHLQLGGKKHRDPTFGGVAIPKMFFKIVACRREDATLGVAAFLMSQEQFLRRIGDRLHGMPEEALEALTDAEARLYQVTVADVEKVTGLRFASLRGKDATIADEARPHSPFEVSSFEDLRILPRSQDDEYGDEVGVAAVR